jgi:hypothetical protein
MSHYGRNHKCRSLKVRDRLVVPTLDILSVVEGAHTRMRYDGPGRASRCCRGRCWDGHTSAPRGELPDAALAEMTELESFDCTKSSASPDDFVPLKMTTV